MKTEKTIDTETIEEVFGIAKDSIERSIKSVVEGPERDLYTRFDGPVDKITVNGEDVIYIW